MMQPLPDQAQVHDPDPLDRIAEANDLASLDEELNQLPEKYRDVLVMSYFARQTNQEIADQINESKGAVDGRIREARRLLRVRLARRGVEIGVLTLAAASVQSTASAASPSLIATTAQFSKLSSGWSGVENVSGVDVTRMNLLSSTGTTAMSIKTGFAILACGLAFCGIVGMTQSLAIQDELPSLAGTPTGETNAILKTRSPDNSEDPAPSGAMTVSITVAETADKKKRKSAVTASEFSRRSAREAERRLYEAFQTQKTPKLSFPGETSLQDILSSIEISIAEQSGESVRIILDEQDPDIGTDPQFLESTQLGQVDIAEGTITIASALDLIFAKVKDQDPPLTWIVEDEVIKITTMDSMNSERHLILRSYDITKLRSVFPDQSYVQSGHLPYLGGKFGGGGMGGLMGGSFQVEEDSESADSDTEDAFAPAQGATTSQPQKTVTVHFSGLIETIYEMSSPPCNWIQNGDDIGSMSLAGNRLLVYQTRIGHEKVVEVLEELELAAENAPE